MNPFRAGALPSGRTFGSAAVFALAAGLGFTLLYYQWALPHGQESFVSHLASVALLLVTVPCTYLRGRARPEERRGWYLLCLSHCVQLSGQGLRLLSFLAVLDPAWLGRLPYLLQLAGATLLGPAMLSWPLSPPSASERRRKALDGAVFAASLFFILWATGWGELFRTSRETGVEKAFTLAFPLLYDLLLGIAIYLAAKDLDRFKGPLGWIGFSIFLSFVGNLLWGFLTLRGAYYVGHPLDITSFFIPLLKFLAPFSTEPVGDPPREDEVHDASLLGSALPYLPLIPALGLGAWMLARGTRGADPVLLWAAIAMIVLLLLRQFLAMRDLQALSLGLEARVAERTRALEESQDALMRTQQMNMVATLGAGLAHDFNNILSVICTTAELARMDIDEGLRPKSRDLETIHVMGKKAGELTSHLMALGRRQETELHVFDLGRQLEELQGLLTRLAPPPTRVEVLASRHPMPIKADPLQIEQILVNLVSNARDAMPGGGLIRIEAHPGPLTSEGSPTILLRVADSGSGISAQTLERIFDPFFTTKAPGKGTGLGLASVKTIVESYGGRLQVESVPQQGTVFSLSFLAAA